MATFDMFVSRLCFRDVKCGGYKWHVVIYTVLFHYYRIHFVKYDVCFKHVCGSLDIWQPPFTFTYGKNNGCFQHVYGHVCVCTFSVCGAFDFKMWNPIANRFWYGHLGLIPWYLARYLGQKKKRARAYIQRKRERDRERDGRTNRQENSRPGRG